MFFIVVVFSHEKKDGSETHAVKSGKVLGIDVSPVSPALTKMLELTSNAAFIGETMYCWGVVGWTINSIGDSAIYAPRFSPTGARS